MPPVAANLLEFDPSRSKPFVRLVLEPQGILDGYGFHLTHRFQEIFAWFELHQPVQSSRWEVLAVALLEALRYPVDDELDSLAVRHRNAQKQLLLAHPLPASCLRAWHQSASSTRLLTPTLS